MVKSCCAYNCTERYKKGGKLSFHIFPNNPDMRKKWILSLRREKFIPTKYSTICSKHFTPESYETSAWSSKKKLKCDAVPIIFNFRAHLKSPSTNGKRLKRRHGANTVLNVLPNTSLLESNPPHTAVENEITAEGLIKKNKRYLGDYTEKINENTSESEDNYEASSNVEEIEEEFASNLDNENLSNIDYAQPDPPIKQSLFKA
ncbi:hypothetical protein RN001_006454 [Aquatica leii]|uniref:THAP-type domain-containing protein n=1 Tax=Aquatica leii TaxID=1421715 RepID=A0AAN7P817_9COLE|nr:hypothetical protein RN001_006454 [Aquatica leii]